MSTVGPVEFRVLGPLEVIEGGRTVEIAAAKERAVLAILLAAANRVVPVDRLIAELWGEDPPRSAHKTLQTYVSHLRRVLGDRLATRPPGYLLLVAEGELDSTEFERIVGEGRLALLRGDGPIAAELLGTGLARWHGAAYEGVDLEGTVRAESVRLDELRLAATEDWLEARIGAGDHRDVAAELDALVALYPLRERLWSLLMQALYRAGRQADALRAFQRARAILVEELGIEPGPELRAVESAVLGQRLTATTHGLQPPAAQYVTNPEGLQIGYSTFGTGSRDLVFLGDVYLSLDLLWEFTELTSVLEPLLPGSRLISVQRRGTRMSDREPDGTLAPPEACIADVDAALLAAGANERVALVGWGHGGQVAIAYAAARPERVSALVAVNTFARLSATAGYDEGYSAEFLETWLSFVGEKWGRNLSAAPIFGPAGDDPLLITRLARLERLVANPRDAVALHRALNHFDVRELVPAVRCPALVVFLTGSVSGRAGARWLADNLPAGHYTELPGHFMPTASEADALGAAIEAFLRDKS